MEPQSVFKTLEAYKKLSVDDGNHHELLKDKTILLYIGTLLDSKDERILSLCLDIVENIIANETCRESVVTTFGIFEALESAYIRVREFAYSLLEERIVRILEVLRQFTPPANSFNHRRNQLNSTRKSIVYLFQLYGLTQENKTKFESELVSIKGVISFVLDSEKQRCIIRVRPKLRVDSMASKLKIICGIDLYLVAPREDSGEDLINPLGTTSAESLYPEYFPEVDSPIRKNAVRSKTTRTESPSNWFKSASSFLSSSFYW